MKPLCPSLPPAMSVFLRQAAQADSLAECIASLLRAVPALVTDVARCSVTLPMTPSRLQVVAMLGDEAVPVGTGLAIYGTSTGLAYETGRVQVVRDVTAELAGGPRGALLDLYLLGQSGLQSCINVPIVVGERAAAVLNVARQYPSDFHDVRALLDALVCTASVQVGLLKRLDEARQERDVLMDLHMPDMDGAELTRRLLGGDGPHAAFVGLTADAFVESRRRCTAAGMQEVLSKPLSLDRLRSTLLRVADAGPRRRRAS